MTGELAHSSSPSPAQAAGEGPGETARRKAKREGRELLPPLPQQVGQPQAPWAGQGGAGPPAAAVGCSLPVAPWHSGPAATLLTKAAPTRGPGPLSWALGLSQEPPLLKVLFTSRLQSRLVSNPLH